jgi:hypothetical protein
MTGTSPPSLLFIHIPKTAGTTFKAFLENYYAHGETLAIPDRVAEHLAPDALRGYSLFCGHYSSDVVAALDRKPDVTVALFREPMDRFRSWTANCRRVNDEKFRDMLVGFTDLEVITGPRNQVCFQAYWLARALHGGAEYAALPSRAELPTMLADIQIVGLTEELERVMQLVAFRSGWPPPPRGWRINRSPGPAAASVRKLTAAAEEAQIRPHLALDDHLYALARQRFWADYCAMLDKLCPDRAPFTAATTVRDDDVQDWLRRDYRERHVRHLSGHATSIDVTAESPLRGEGWWWREVPGAFAAYRWSGPGNTASLFFEPLAPGLDYELTVDVMGAADESTWEGLALEVNGQPVPAAQERVAAPAPGAPSLRLRARLTPDLVATRDGMIRLTFRVPETKPAHRHIMVLETFDTYNPDERHKGLAVHRVKIEPRPVPETRRPPEGF